DPANQLPCTLRFYSPSRLLRSASDQDESLAPICFPPDNFKHS
ncbi:unnamed protein product, partial [Brassica rapa subsp. trilocularis]